MSIYAQKGIYDTLVEKLGAAVATLKSGAPDDESTELGPLSSLAHLERVSKAVEEAKATGHIKVITGGESARVMAITMRRRCWLAHYRTMPSCKEVFGPVASVTPFDNEEQVVNWRTTASTDLHLRYGRKMWAGRIASAHGCNMVVPG